MGIIYKYTSPSGKSYIGKTVDTLENRWKYHVYDCNRATKTNFQIRGSPLLTNAILKYGENSFIRIILKDNIPDDELYKWEDHYILQENTLCPNGYNVRIGSITNHRISDDLKQKISIKTKKISNRKRCCFKKNKRL